MKAVLLEGPGTQPTVRDDVADPVPAANEVLVRVQASSANPVDNAIAAGMLSDMVGHDFPITLGRDFAGVVEEIGSDVTQPAAGDEVFGFVPFANPNVHDGSWAELITVRGDSVGRKPAGVDLAGAGAAPLTAMDALELSGGDTILVVGASGGVGSFAVQLAASEGINVVAPALPEDEEYLRDLGAGELLDRDADVGEGVADAVLDLVSYAPGAFDVALKEGGRVASPNSAAGEGPGRTNVLAVPSAENLERLARLLDDGTLRVPIQETYELERAGEALEALGTTHTQGKRAVRVA